MQRSAPIKNLFAVHNRFGMNSDRINFLPTGRQCVHAAEGVARLTEKPQFVLLNGQNELFEAVQALGTPHGDDVPLVIFAFLDSSRDQTAFIQGRQLLSHLARRIIELSEPEHLSEPLQFLPGVNVVLVLRNGICKRDLGRFVNRTIRNLQVEPEPDRPLYIPDRFYRSFRQAKRPVLLVGRRAMRECSPEILARFAWANRCPIVLSTGATSGADHFLKSWEPYKRWIRIISGNNLIAMRALLHSDFIFAMDCELRESDFFGFEDFSLIRGRIATIQNRARLQNKATFHLTGPLLKVLEHIMDHGALPSMRVQRKRLQYQRSLARAKQQLLRYQKSFAIQNQFERPLHPASVANRIFEDYSGEVLISEGSFTGMWPFAYRPWFQSVLFPDHMASIGISFHWLEGLARSGVLRQAGSTRPAWLFLGDGSFVFQSHCLAKLAWIKTPAIIFVFNNASYSSMRLGQSLMLNGNHTGTDLVDRDLGEISRIYGLRSKTIRSIGDLHYALKEAREEIQRAPGPVILDIRVRKDAIPFCGWSYGAAEGDQALKPRAGSVVKNFFRMLWQRTIDPGLLRFFWRVIVC